MCRPHQGCPAHRQGEGMRDLWSDPAMMIRLWSDSAIMIKIWSDPAIMIRLWSDPAMEKWRLKSIEEEKSEDSEKKSIEEDKNEDWKVLNK